MTSRKFFKYVIVLNISVLLFSGCLQQKDDSKIPITTASKEARELYLKGRDLSERLRGQESLQYYQQAVDKDPDFAFGYLGLATNAPSAKAFFENLDKAVALVDKVSEGEKLLIMASRRGADGKPAEQQELLKQVVTAYPNDERAHNFLANNLFFAHQQYEAGLEEYKKAVEINPDFSPPYNSMGYALRTLERYDEAEDAFKKYIGLIPDDPNPYDSYAELQMKMGQYDKSIENYQKALELKSDFVASYIGIACNYTFKGEHEKAGETLDKLYSVAKNDGERRTSHFSKAVCYVDQGNFDAALSELHEQHALAAKINDYAAMAGDLGTMGNILLETGRADAAMAKYKQAVMTMEQSNLSDENKKNARRGFLFNSARVAMKKKDFKEAKAKAEEYRQEVYAINNHFQKKAAHQLAGEIALAQKDFDTALTELQQANDQNPYNLYRTGMAYEGMGNMTKAKEMYDDAVRFNALSSMNQAFVRVKANQMMTAK